MKNFKRREKMTGAESLFTGKDEIGDKNGHRICIYDKQGRVTYV